MGIFWKNAERKPRKEKTGNWKVENGIHRIR